MSLKTQRRHGGISPLVLTLVAGLMVAGITAWLTHRARHAAQTDFTRTAFRLNRINALPYAPQEGAPAALVSSNEVLRSLIEEQSNALADAWELRRGTLPRDSTALFFKLAELTEQNRKRARAMGVELREDERFGFSEFSRQGPEDGILEAVNAQAVLQFLILDDLWEARPARLLDVQRTWVSDGGSVQEPIDPWSDVPNPPQMPKLDDLYKTDVSRTVCPDGIRSFRFRYEFEGYSASLRRWLAALQSETLPVYAVAVSVEPAEAVSSRKESVKTGAGRADTRENPFLVFEEEQARESSEPKAVPIIRENLSHFTVEIECLLPVIGEGGAQ